MNELPYICPEHPNAKILHTWDQTHCVLNYYPSGLGIKSNHCYECVVCGRKLAAELPRSMEERKR